MSRHCMRPYHCRASISRSDHVNVYLKRNGIDASIYDVSTQPGGRCLPLIGIFPGQLRISRVSR